MPVNTRNLDQDALRREKFQGTIEQKLNVLWMDTDRQWTQCLVRTFTPNCVLPLLQHNEPKCGIMALCMALQSCYNYEVGSDDVLQYAITAGYTKRGELFSSTAMLQIAQHFISGNFQQNQLVNERVQLCKWSNAEDIVKWFMDDTMAILVPYDKERNHEPSISLGGHQAHWALVFGLVSTLVGNDLVGNGDDDASDQQLSIAFQHASDGNDDLVMLGNETVRYVVAYQSQSLHPQIWSIANLFSSCQQLQSVSPRVLQRKDSYIIPHESGNLADYLAQTVIKLRR
ncbi:hypothetical protein MIR68_000409 [Amoeboaphelidium protococcarum]|nr:hypothetical protein MIR68_000409 [Amoeboaphelidium protococcarum]KAI3646186.1 hypothetical protein MP228_009114 [Amoeboaphelidium protococcarum]